MATWLHRARGTANASARVDSFISLRNAGRQPLRVTALEAGGEGLLLRGRLEDAPWLPAGQEVRVPLSVLLDCDEAEPWPDPARWVADVHVRRGAGSRAERRTSLDGVPLVTDVARTLCTVRPRLRGYELSGPVLRPRTGAP